jgi:hypothetical protein
MLKRYCTSIMHSLAAAGVLGLALIRPVAPPSIQNNDETDEVQQVLDVHGSTP